MTVTHNPGFPRIGAKRELKFALEKFWKGNLDARHLQDTASELRLANWQIQSGLDFVPVGDFSLYDHVLDMSFTLGNIPERIRKIDGNQQDSYFRLARGRSANDPDKNCVRAGDMKKWFDSNYHYIVPEFDANTSFSLDPEQLLAQIKQAKTAGFQPKPTLIGPISYLWLGKSLDGSGKLKLLDRLIPAYAELLKLIQDQGVKWVQIDEPILVTELTQEWQQIFASVYARLRAASSVKMLLATYFGSLQENLLIACSLPVSGLHIDAINAGDELAKAASLLPQDSILSAGIINGRNIWKNDFEHSLNLLEPIAEQISERLWLAPSCSLLHVPVDLDSETRLDPEIKDWMAFARQKLDELQIIAKALDEGRSAVAAQLAQNAASMTARRNSSRVHNPQIQAKTAKISKELGERKSPYQQRSQLQRQRLNLPLLPTTTIGSFPQTASIRQTRRQYKSGEIDQQTYQAKIRQEIEQALRQQEKIGLDVLVHGEAERNDMVEYFGEQLQGCIFSRSGWVQSYGSRCVKPPIIYGDIHRPQPMTPEWISYAQSLTDKPVKGMLTGPVTILNWSFVRDDQSREASCKQLALAIRAETLDLEQAGAKIIQIDEAALREGLPLRRSEWNNYLDWAIESFRIAANGVADHTQIHTHMCYSRFNDIIEAIARMDADVITIETSRSDMELLDAFDHFSYPNEIGPGVYDIHSPNIPEQEHIIALMQKAAMRIPVERLWINPDCGLKTRQWDEVIPALRNMVSAAKALRERLA